MRFDALFDANGVFLETENYLLRRISPTEKSLYEALAQEDAPDFLQAVSDFLAWEELLSKDHLTCSILQKETGAFCGFCQLQWVFSDTPELGIDLCKGFQGKGIAAEILPLFLAHAKQLLHCKYFRSKIKKNNIPSQKLAESIGGIQVGEKNILPAEMPEEMLAFAARTMPEFFFLEYHFLL